MFSIVVLRSGDVTASEVSSRGLLSNKAKNQHENGTVLLLSLHVSRSVHRLGSDLSRIQNTSGGCLLLYFFLSQTVLFTKKRERDTYEESIDPLLAFDEEELMELEKVALLDAERRSQEASQEKVCPMSLQAESLKEKRERTGDDPTYYVRRERREKIEEEKLEELPWGLRRSRRKRESNSNFINLEDFDLEDEWQTIPQEILNRSASVKRETTKEETGRERNRGRERDKVRERERERETEKEVREAERNKAVKDNKQQEISLQQQGSKSTLEPVLAHPEVYDETEDYAPRKLYELDIDTTGIQDLSKIMLVSIKTNRHKLKKKRSFMFLNEAKKESPKVDADKSLSSRKKAKGKEEKNSNNNKSTRTARQPSTPQTRNKKDKKYRTPNTPSSDESSPLSLSPSPRTTTAGCNSNSNGTERAYNFRSKRLNLSDSSSPSPSSSSSTSSSPLNSFPSSPLPSSQSSIRKRKCNCDGCVRDDCLRCRFCLDKPKYGGEDKLRQRCELRKCVHTS